MHLQRDGNRQFRNRRGTSYVEYFLAAGAIAVAAMAIFSRIEQGDTGAVGREYERQLRELAGPLSADPGQVLPRGSGTDAQ